MNATPMPLNARRTTGVTQSERTRVVVLKTLRRSRGVRRLASTMLQQTGCAEWRNTGKGRDRCFLRSIVVVAGGAEEGGDMRRR